LISNTVKFTPKGEVEISAQLLEKEEDKAIIRFAVRDTGIGIDEENLQKLLTPFTQADGRTTRLYGGTGLGLSISEKLLNLMDSHLQLAGESGKGSTFFFDLNLKIQKQENQSQSKKEQADSNEFIIFPHKVKIMVAEDNLVNQKLLRKFINSCAPQADLMICNNGEEVLQEFMNFQPDYVFMDVHMPVMNGYLATEYIRNNFKNTHIPVIAISAGVSDDEVDLAKKSGMNAFVPKPFNLKSISEILHDFLPVE
jgi:CheY-like chemotaxis protein